MNVYELLREIKTKYLARMDARDEKRKKKIHIVNHDPKKQFITINHQPVPLEDDGSLGGEIGKEIEKNEEEAKTKKAENPRDNENGDKSTDEEKKTSENGQNKGQSAKQQAKAERDKYRAMSQDQLKKIVGERLKEGTYSQAVKKDKQREHIPGTKEYQKRVAEKKYPSYLTIPEEDVQKLVDKYITEGTVLYESGNLRVLFEHTEVIGEAVKKGDSNTHVPTKWGKIILSRDGTHIVPVIP